MLLCIKSTIGVVKFQAYIIASQVLLEKETVLLSTIENISTTNNNTIERKLMKKIEWY